MRRIPEPELMDDAEQARAYAEADFSEPHGHFIELFEQYFGSSVGHGVALDLGCGPGDIAMRFARAHPAMRVHGVDGAQAMLDCGRHLLANNPELASRVQLIRGLLPKAILPCRTYDVIISNSLLHHLHDPQVLWQTVRRFGREGTAVLIMDLMRPDRKERARELVDTYAGTEPEVLRRDFFHSLLAAFRPNEVRAQLLAAGLQHLTVRVVSDRHLAISGRL